MAERRLGKGGCRGASGEGRLGRKEKGLGRKGVEEVGQKLSHWDLIQRDRQTQPRLGDDEDSRLLPPPQYACL